MGARGNVGSALYVAKGSNSLVAVMRPIYAAPPGCVVNSAKVIWSPECERNAWSTSSVLGGWRQETSFSRTGRLDSMLISGRDPAEGE